VLVVASTGKQQIGTWDGRTERRHVIQAGTANPKPAPAKVSRAVLLVDDHELVRLGIKVLLTALPDVDCEVTACASIGEARSACRAGRRFDLVLLDLNLHDSKGLQGLRILREDCPHLPIAILTGTHDEFVVRQAQAMGASGFLLKNAATEQLKSAIRGLLRVPMRPSLGESSIAERFPRLAGTSHYDRVAELGARHIEILELVLEGCSNQEISRATNLSLGTVKNYVSAILLALDVKSRAHLITLFH
jgi:DNA-binding NarL/FixJ family response regulator